MEKAVLMAGSLKISLCWKAITLDKTENNFLANTFMSEGKEGKAYWKLEAYVTLSVEKLSLLTLEFPQGGS